MQIRFDCPSDHCVALIEYEPLEDCARSIQCPRCKADVPMGVTEVIRREHIVDVCSICGGNDFYIRKDFPQRLGLAIVIVFGLAAIYYFRISVVKAWLVLTAAVVLDLIIYVVRPKVTICYTCRASYRKCRLNPKHDGFSLGRSMQYP